MNYFIRIFKHLKVVFHHKHLVFKFMSILGHPVRGFLHDMSKFSFTEMAESVKFFNGNCSPIDEAKRVNGYSKAWEHHLKKNPHHFLYWNIETYVPFLGSYSIRAKMPFIYVEEAICDGLAAGMTYCSDSWDVLNPIKYFDSSISKIDMNEDTKLFVEFCYIHIAKEGVGFLYKIRDLEDFYNKIDHLFDSSHFLSVREEIDSVRRELNL